MTIGTPTSIVASASANTNSGSAAALTSNADAPAGSLIIASVQCVTSNTQLNAFSDSVNGAWNVIQPGATSTQLNTALCWIITTKDTPSGTSFTGTTSSGQWAYQGIWSVSGCTKGGLGTSQTGSVAATSTGTSQSTGALKFQPQIVFGQASINAAVTYTTASGFNNLFGNGAQINGGLDYQIVSAITSVTWAPTWGSTTNPVGWELVSFMGTAPAIPPIWKNHHVPQPEWVPPQMQGPKRAMPLWQLLSPKLRINPGQVQQKFWRYDYDSAPAAWFNDKIEWMNSGVIQQLAHQKLYGAVGQVLQKFWRYDFVPPPDWAPDPETLNVPTSVIESIVDLPRSPMYALRPSGMTDYWMGQPLAQPPFINSYFPPSAPSSPPLYVRTQQDLQLWSWKPPIDLNQTTLAPSTEPFSKLWRYDYVPPSDWLGTPTAINYPQTLQPKINYQAFGALWRYDYVPPPDWLGTPQAYPQTLVPAQNNPFFKLWRYDYVPPPDWVAFVEYEDADALQMLDFKPFIPPQWTDLYVPPSDWAPALDNLQANTLDLLIIGGTPAHKLWRWDHVPDPPWVVMPENMDADALQMLGFKPTSPQKLWRWDYVPPSDWLGQSTIDLNLTTLAAKQTEPFNKLWRYDLDTDVRIWSPTLENLNVPPSNIPPTTFLPRSPFYSSKPSGITDWVGTPLAYPQTLVAKQSNPFFKLWRYDYVPPVDWLGTPTAINYPQTLQPATKYQPLGAMWRYDHVPLPDWLAEPVAYPLSLRPTTTKPRVPLQWSNFYYVPPTEWVGKPSTLGTFQKFPPAKPLSPFIPPIWSDTHVPSPYWMGTPIAFPLLQQPPVEFEPFGGMYQFNYVPQPDWLGQPIATPATVINEYQPQALLPFESPFWAPTKQEIAPNFPVSSAFQALQTPGIQAEPFSKLWRYDTVPPPDWVWQPPFSPTIFESHGAPFHKQWRWDLVPASEWVGQAIAPRQAFLATSVTPIAKLWRWDLTPPPDWVWQPPFSPTLQKLAVSPTSPTKQWHWDYDPPPPWAPQIENLDAYILLKLAVQPTFPPLWSNTFVPASEWVGRATNFNRNLITPTAPLNPFIPPLWSDVYVPPTYWQGQPTASYAFLPKVPNVAPLRYQNYVPPPDWLGTPIGTTQAQFTKQTNPFFRLWRWDQVPATDWLWTPPHAQTLSFLTQGTPFIRLNRFDVVPDPQFLATRLGMSMAAFTAFLTPFVQGMRRADYVAPPDWLAFLQYAWALILPPAEEEEGHAWRRLLAYTIPGTLLNRDVPPYLKERRDPDEDDIITWLLGDL